MRQSKAPKSRRKRTATADVFSANASAKGMVTRCSALSSHSCKACHGVVGLARGAQHPVGDGSQPGPVLLESFCQPVALVHRSVDPSRALNVTSRFRAAGCLPIEIVNEKETGHGDVS